MNCSFCRGGVGGKSVKFHGMIYCSAKCHQDWRDTLRAEHQQRLRIAQFLEYLRIPLTVMRR